MAPHESSGGAAAALALQAGGSAHGAKAAALGAAAGAGREQACFPLRFVAWCAVKTLTQLGVTLCAIAMALESGFWSAGLLYGGGDRGGYVGSGWAVESVQRIYVVQAVFELVDLAVELWMTLSADAGNDAHLPWDSIVHHFVSAAYALFVVATAPQQDALFLGLSVIAQGCQLIGPLYTANRLGLGRRFAQLPALILAVQLCWRLPLAAASLARAMQHWQVTPWPHLLICAILAHLDYRWTWWAVDLYRDAQVAAARSRAAGKRE
jgi:hypothetical protein